MSTLMVIKIKLTQIRFVFFLISFTKPDLSLNSLETHPKPKFLSIKVNSQLAIMNPLVERRNDCIRQLYVLIVERC